MARSSEKWGGVKWKRLHGARYLHHLELQRQAKEIVTLKMNE